MIFSKIRYINPDLESDGNGLTPSQALSDIPSKLNLEDDCLYIIKRVESYCTLPSFSSYDTAIKKIGLIGCPKLNDEIYCQLPYPDRKRLENAGWISSEIERANVKSSGTNVMQFAFSSITHFVMRDINLMRAIDSETNFSVSDTSTSAVYLLQFSSSMDICDIQGCRFSADGVNIDSNSYINETPSMKSCSYVYAYGGGGDFIFNNNIVCYIPKTLTSSSSPQAGIRLGGSWENVSFCSNSCYMCPSNATTYITSATAASGFSIRQLFNTGTSLHYYVKINNNTMKIRDCSYYNLAGWIFVTSQENLEFIGNSVSSGNHMGTYDYSEFKLRIFASTFIDLSNDDTNITYGYIVKDFTCNIPEMWNIYDSSILRCNFYNNGSAVSEGQSKFTAQRVCENITINLGNGPSISEISTANQTILDSEQYGAAASFHSSAFYFSGFENGTNAYMFQKFNYRGNTLKNISVSHPWGYAVSVRCANVECTNVYGSVAADQSSFLHINSMKIKKSHTYGIKVVDCGSIFIDELDVEDTSGTRYCSFDSTKFALQINKQNHKIIDNSFDLSTNAAYYNESFIFQKDIGSEHEFSYRSINKYFESCNIKRYDNPTIRIFGTPSCESTTNFRYFGLGNCCLSKKSVVPGKYRITVHGSFYGDDIYANTVESQSSDRKNLLNNIRFGIRTGSRYIYNTPISLVDNSDGWSWYPCTTPFKQEFYVDVEDESNSSGEEVFLTLHKFSLFSSYYDLNNPSASVFVDPDFDVFNLSDFEESNSYSISDYIDNSNSVSESAFDPMNLSGIVFYAPLSSDIATAETGQTLTKVETVTFENNAANVADGSCISFPDTGLPSGNSDRTIAFRAKVNSIPDSTRSVIFAYGDGGGLNTMSYVGIKSDGSVCAGGAGSESYEHATAGSLITLGTEYTYIYTHSSSGEEKIYINNTLIDTWNMERATSLSVGQIGRYSSGGHFTNGYIADAMIFNRVITESERQSLFN